MSRQIARATDSSATRRIRRRLVTALTLCISLNCEFSPAAEASKRVDATTLHGKVLCGYQGWFRCPGDGSGEGWLHWSRNRRRITPATVTFEMWPDLSEYSEQEKHRAPGFFHADKRPAHLFSSVNPRTVERHFDWMKHYGIDGVFLQRFLVNLGRPSFDTVLANVRRAAKSSGRVYAICYDLTGAPADKIYDLLTRDWKRLVDREKITHDDRYLHHRGQPVLFVWGFFPDRFDAAIAHRLIDFLKKDSRYRATLVGGCPWHWRQTKDQEWARAFRRFDCISPWNVGHYALEGGNRVAATGTWAADMKEAKSHNMEFLPVIYPGFGWTNLKGPAASRATIPRRKGAFFWEQFVKSRQLGVKVAYVAMFDEVDEATAIFKVSNDPPAQATFQTLEGLPTDHYLRLTGRGARLIRGEPPQRKSPATSGR